MKKESVDQWKQESVDRLKEKLLHFYLGRPYEDNLDDMHRELCDLINDIIIHLKESE